MKFYPIGKTHQFKDECKTMKVQCAYDNVDCPKVIATGTIKTHGSNASLQYTPEAGVRAGKRSQFLSKEQLKSHFGFAQYVYATYKDEVELFVKNQFEYFTEKYTEEEKETLQLVLFGEWCGKGIQSGVGISKIQKSFILFSGMLTNSITGKLVETVNISTLRTGIPRFYNVYQFPTYEIEIDFANPELSTNEMVDITNAIEKECPVAKEILGDKRKSRVLTRWEKFTNFFGFTSHEAFEEGLVGEGVVWNFVTNHSGKEEHRKFKVKGLKHRSSGSGGKKLVKVDEETLKNAATFVEYACTPNRMAQCLFEVAVEAELDSQEDLTRKHTGLVMKWIGQDILKEESKALEANGLEWGNVQSAIATKMRNYFFQHIDTIKKDETSK